MFDPKEYKNACAQITLGQEKLEELITMTENTNKKPMSRSMKTVLIAAACIAALTVTAFAAPAVQQLFVTSVITLRGTGGNVETAQLFTCPSLALERRGDKDIFHMDDEELDVTDAFAQDGQYVLERDGATITVKPDGWVVISMRSEEDVPVTYTFNLNESAQSAPATIDMDGETLTGGDVGTYTVTADENGAIDVEALVSPAE